ncbi:MAG: tetratricopeptide repeat protein [Candidatus Hodarchaeales archaeon]
MAFPDDYFKLKQLISEAKRQGFLGNFNEALQILRNIASDYMERVVSDQNYRVLISLVVEAMFLEGHFLIDMNEFVLADKQARKIKAFSKKTNYLPGLARAYQILSNSAIRTYNIDVGKVLAEKSLKISDKVMLNGEDHKLSLLLDASAHHLLGVVYWTKGDFDRSIIHNTKAIESSKRINDYYALAKSYNNLANCYADKGDHDRAIETYKMSGKITEKMGNRYGTALSLANISWEYRLIGEYSRALSTNQESLNIFLNIGMEKATTINLQNFGRIYLDKGEYDKAATYFDRALELIYALGLSREKAVVLGDYARLLFSSGQFERAKEMYERSLANYETIGTEEELVLKLCSYSELLIILDESSRAEEILTEAIDVASRHNSKWENLDCMFTEALIEKYYENYGIAKNLLKEILKQIKQTPYVEIYIRSCLLLATFCVESFQRDQLKKSFNEALGYIEKAEKLSVNSRMHPKLLQTLIIKATLYSASLEFELALESLYRALEISKKRKLVVFTRQIEETTNQIYDRKTLASQVSGNTLATLKKLAAEDVLRLMNFNRPQKDSDIINEFRSETIFATIFKYDVGQGTVVVATEKLPFHDSDKVLYLIGSFYTLAIGQGNRHHQGLFGPLPLGDYNDYLSLIYARTVKDGTQNDPRMNGMSYCLFCLIYPVRFSKLFYDRSFLSSVIEQSILTIEDVTDISSKYIVSFKNIICNAITSVSHG